MGMIRSLLTLHACERGLFRRALYGRKDVTGKSSTFGELVAAGMLAIPLACAAQAQTGGCGSLENSYGPFDYRPEMFKPTPGDSEPHKVKRSLVEGAHFTLQVQMLIRGATASLPGQDLDYTLRVFPNHHRALATVLRGLEVKKLMQIPGAQYSSDCYFNRAVAFRPDDTTVRMLFSTFLNLSGRREEALKQLEAAGSFAGSNPFIHYNLGLHYLGLKGYDKARQHAQEALTLGLPRTELRDKLVAVGQWRESPAAAASSAIGPDRAASPATP